MFNSPLPRLKIVFAVLVMTAGMVVFGFVSPQDLRYETVNGITWSYVVENETAKVTNWNMSPAVPSSTTGNVVVPDSLGGYPVTAIGNYAFYQISGITSLTIPEGVEMIETYACLKCTGLETVSLPSTLKTMGDAVFSGCESLRAGAIPDSVTSMGRDTFWGCKAMTAVKFSANVTSLGAMTCYNCDSLTEVLIPYGVTNIGVSAFLHCDNLRTISIPETATEIDNYAFNNCPLLEALELPGGMTVLRDIFSGCKSLRTIDIPAGVSSITASTFYGCTNMTSITVAEGSAAYKSMDGILYDITGDTLIAWPPALPIPASIPQGIKRIGDYVFSGRRDLTAIEIPEGVESIGVSAFDMCQNLSSITLPTTLKTVGERAFFGCSPISSATFYDGFESVGEKAFGRTGITSLVFPPSTALIGVAAFRECASLQSLEVLSPTCSIQSYAFADCPRLVSINIADGANVSSNAFGDPPVVEPEEPSEPDDPSGATIYRDCFRIEPGQIPHLVCTVEGLEGIDYAVEKYETNDWQVVIHGWGMDDARIKKANPGAHLLDDNDMPSGVLEVTGTAQPFVFEFCNWYRSGALGNKTWYGYVSIALDANARLVILESALCNQQNVLTVTGGTGDNNLIVDESGSFIEFATNPDIRFRAQQRSPNDWEFRSACSVGRAYVTEGVLDEPVGDETFSNHWSSVVGTGDVFRVAFMWQSQDGASTLYGWVTLKIIDGRFTIIAQETAEAPNVVVVGRNDQSAMPPDDIETLDGIIWQCDFERASDHNSLQSVSELERHVVRGGDMRCYTLTNHMGRACGEFTELKPCMMVWFSLNETGHFTLGNYSYYESVGEVFAPKLWESVGVAFRLWSDGAAVEEQAQYSELPQYGTTWFHDLYVRSEQMSMPIQPLGSVVNIDDKLALRYLLYEAGDGTCRTNWQLNAGVLDASGCVVERSVELMSANPKRSLPIPVGHWTTISVEAENDASVTGPAFRIYIGGMLAVSAEDGRSVFRARPTASDKTGLAAVGLGGAGYVDDITFFRKSRNPMEGIEVSAQEKFSEEETATIAAIVGEDAINGLRGIYLRDCDGEAEGAYKLCVQLGITPSERDGDDKYQTFSFKNPTVTIVSFDPAERTIIGKIVPAEGTRIAAPPMTYMFGLTEIYELGTEWQYNSEWGYNCVHGYSGFSVDLTSYMISNGVFKITFPEWLLEKDSRFFSITIKPYDDH